MRWKRASRNYVDDRRGSGGGGFGGGLSRGGGIPIPIPTGRGGAGGIGLLIVIAVIAFQMCSGGGLSLPGGGGGGGGGDAGGGGLGGPLGGITAPRGGGGDGGGEGEPNVDSGEEPVEFVKAVAEDVQVMWQEAFASANREYRDATVVLFTDGVDTGCGPASSAVGPFYCPPDEDIYIDLAFFDQLHQQFGAPGDFAQAYVIAHEFGHHVQTVLGISERVRAEQQRNPDAANDLSVRMELQADCFAGLWAYTVFNDPDDAAVQQITQEDVREGLDAAAAVGDDRLSGGNSSPESWTHGSSEQRMEWFQRGFEQGSADACDTFGQ